MTSITQILSTREISLLIWLLVILIFLTIKSNDAKGWFTIIKLFFGSKIFPVFILLSIYVSLILTILYKVSFLNNSLTKDTIFWFITVAMVFFFRVNQMKERGYFMEMFKDCFKWGVVLDFLVNFYTFSLPVELAFVPIVIIITALQAFSKDKPQYIDVYNFLGKVLTISGILLSMFVAYKSVSNIQTFLTINNLRSFLLTPLLTILLIPFIYILSLFINYEELFTRIDFLTNKPQFKWPLKKAILFEANFNIDKLMSITKLLNKSQLYQVDNLTSYIKSISKG